MTSKSMLALGVTSIATRVFYSVAIDGYTVNNTGWLCAILGALFALPLPLCLTSIGENRISVERSLGKAFPILRSAFALVLLLYSVFDAAIGMRVLVGSAIRLALTEFSEITLLLVLGGLLFLCAKYGIEPIGNAARFWNRACIAILIMNILLNIQFMNPRYLTPILGPGVAALVDKSLEIAGIYTMLVGLNFVAGMKRSPDGTRWDMLRVYGEAALISTALIAVYNALFPVLRDEPDRFSFHIDRLLTNGQFVVSMQLPIVFTWYMVWMFTILYFVLAGTKALTLLFRKLHWFLAAAISCVSACALSLYTSFYYTFPAFVSQTRVIVFLLPCLVLCGWMLIQNRRNAHA